MAQKSLLALQMAKLTPLFNVKVSFIVSVLPPRSISMTHWSEHAGVEHSLPPSSLVQLTSALTVVADSRWARSSLRDAYSQRKILPL